MTSRGKIRPLSFALVALGVVLLVLYLVWREQAEPEPWTAAELAILQTLTLDQLPPLPADPSNAVGDTPAAALLGQRLFYDMRLSGSGTFSCSSCHRPELRFTDGLQRGRAMGRSKRNTPSIVGTAYSPWLYWDGRKDSQWSQALSPLEDPAEQGSNRMHLVRVLSDDAAYRQAYTELFGALPDFSDRTRFPDQAGPIPAKPDWNTAWQQMQEGDRHLVNTVFANMGKVIAAYERLLLPSPSRFDRYVETLQPVTTGVAAQEQKAQTKQAQTQKARKENAAPLPQSSFSKEEIYGLRLFIGKARCLECHNGPLLTNNEFHNTGLLPLPGEVPDQGRSKVLDQLRADPFNCLGLYSDAQAGQCKELEYMRTGVELLGALRTPSLRNLGSTGPYMHEGQIVTLREALENYNKAPLALIGHNEATALNLSRRQIRQLNAFLLTLDAPVAGSADLLKPLKP